MKRVSWFVRMTAAVGLATAMTHTVAFATPGGDSSKIDLKLKFQSNQSQFIETTRKMQQKIDMAGQPMAQDVNTTTVLRESVGAVNDGIGAIELTFDRMAMDMAMMPGGSMAFDSDHPDADPGAARMLGRIFGGMVDKTMTMKLGPDGKVHEFSGMNEIRDKIAKKASASPLWMRMQGQLNDESARVEYGESRFEFLPDQPVAKGDKWTREIKRDAPPMGKTVSTTTYRFTDITDLEHAGSTRRVAVIEYQGTMKSAAGADPAPGAAGMPQPKIESSEFSGTVKFDIERGCVLVDERTGTMKLTMDGGPMGKMTIDAKLNQRSAVLSRDERAAQKEASKPKKEKEEEKAGPDGAKGD